MHFIGDHPRFHHGFTLTELVVALMLLTVGVLALSSTATVVAYEAAASGRSERAAGVALARLESLRSDGCDRASGGSATQGGLTERWTVRQSHGAAITVVDVTVAQRGRELSHRYMAGFPC